MAINKPDWETKTQSDRDKEAEGVFEKPVLSEETIAVQELYSKVREGFDKINEHITKVASMQSEIDTEKTKTGITTDQANAIVANTAKTGITTQQANFITALNEGRSQAVATNQKNVTATIEPTVTIGKANTLNFKVTLSSGTVYTTSLNLTLSK